MGFIEEYAEVVKRLAAAQPEGWCFSGGGGVLRAPLGRRLPQVLRDFHLSAGKLDAINRAHNDLLPLTARTTEKNPITRHYREVHVQGDVLLIYVENQGVVVWGIPANQLPEADPPVLCAEPGCVPQWRTEFRCLSDFLQFMLYWQACNGGLPFGGIGQVEADGIATLKRQWESALTHGGISVFRGDGSAVCLSADTGEVYAAARSDEAFEQIDHALEPHWSYTWPDDQEEM